MADKDESMNTRKKSARPSAPPTLDLTAKDVSPPKPVEAEEPAKAADPAAAQPEPASSSAQSSAPPPKRPASPPPRTSTVADVEARYGMRHPDPPRSEPARTPVGAVALAGLGGGAVGAAVVALLAGAGYFSTSSGGIDPREALAPQIAEINSAISELRTTTSTNSAGLGELRTATAGNTASLGELGTGLKNATDNAQTAAATAVQAKGVADETALKLANLPPPAPAAAPPPPVDLDPLRARIDQVESANAALQGAIAPLADASKIANAQLANDSRRIDSLEKAVAEGSRDRTAAYAVALGQLGEALRAGTPYEAELAAARAVGGEDGAALAPLSAQAGQGIATTGELARQFDTISSQLVAALAPKVPEAPPDAGFFDRLWFNFSNSGTMTREGEVAAAGVSVRKVAELLHGGDLVQALSVFDTLPVPVKALAGEWSSRAREVLRVRTLVRDDLIAILNKLSRP